MSKSSIYIQEVNRIREVNFSNTPQLNKAISTKRYIDRNYHNVLNLNILAHAILTSKYHLIRIFKKYYGTTPRQYMIDKRITEAKALLNSGFSVSETCYSVGFSSINSFSNLFKIKSGLSPSEYRKATFDIHGRKRL